MTVFEIQDDKTVIIKLVTNHKEEEVLRKHATAKDFVKHMLRKGENLKPRFDFNENWIVSFKDIKDPIVQNGKIIERHNEIILEEV